MFKILIIGLGSAGQRHLRIVKKIFFKKKLEIFVLEKQKEI